MKKLPIYKLTISESDTDKSEVNYVALVDDPAIQMNWMAFKKQDQFKTVNSERKIISGALMVADLPIYRNDEKLGEYYVVFDKDSIEKIAQKFFRKDYTKNVNQMHDPNRVVDGVYMFESFLVDNERGILSPKGFDLTEGSWFGSFKVDNQQVWDEYIKTGIFKGFSVEGIFEYNYEEDGKLTDIVKTIKEILS